jgi:hypothetical protein
VMLMWWNDRSFTKIVSLSTMFVPLLTVVITGQINK